VYTHQGSCEHALRVRDVRRACAADARGRDAYPLVTYRTERPRKRCAICDSLLATKVVYGSRLAPESPCFFCDECFQARRGGLRVHACAFSFLFVLIALIVLIVSRALLRARSGCTTTRRGGCCSRTSRCTRTTDARCPAWRRARFERA
jgi:hypothetical protein